MELANCNSTPRAPWNKGKLVGQKAPLKLKEIWAIRVRLHLILRPTSKTYHSAAWLTADMTKMSPVLRIKAELALDAASEKLQSQHAHLLAAPATRTHADTVTVIRKELDKLVAILADDASEKHFNVAARVAKCADYLAPIPSAHVQDARTFMVEAHRVLQDIHEITL